MRLLGYGSSRRLASVSSLRSADERALPVLPLVTRRRWLLGALVLLGSAVCLRVLTQPTQSTAPAPPSDPRVALAMPPPSTAPELLACVFTDEGRPLAKEEVHVFDSWEDFHGEADVALHLTGADGCVHLPGTAPRWALWFSPRTELPTPGLIGRTLDIPPRYDDAVLLGPERTRWAWSIGPTCPQRFVVTDAAGEPVAGVWLYAGKQGNVMPQGLGVTDAEGVLQADQLACSAERVGVTPPAPYEPRRSVPLEEAAKGIRLRRAP